MPSDKMHMQTHLFSKAAIGMTVLMVSMVGQYLISFGTQIVMARLLLPEHFGEVAFASMIALFAGAFCNSHGEKYIIKEKEGSHEKLNNVFTLELILSGLCLVLMVFVIPGVLRLLQKEHMTRVAQVLTLTYFYIPFSRQRYLLEKELHFKKTSSLFLLGKCLGSATGIVLAMMGYGVWALAALLLASQFFECLLLWMYVSYRPRLAFDRRIIKEIIHYGWPLVSAAVLIFFYWNIDYYIVGQLLGEVQLGYYYFSFRITHYLLSIRKSIVQVVFPAFSKMSRDADMQKGVQLLMKYTAIIYGFPVVVLFLLGRPTIVLFFGEKWLPALLPLQICMISTMLRACSSYGAPLFYAKGKTKVEFYLTLYGTLLIPILGYVLTKQWGVPGMAVAVLALCSSVFVLLILIIRRLFFPLHIVSILKKPLMVLCSSGILAYFFSHILYTDHMGLYLLYVGSALLGYVLLFYPEACYVKTMIRKVKPS